MDDKKEVKATAATAKKETAAKKPAAKKATAAKKPAAKKATAAKKPAAKKATAAKKPAAKKAAAKKVVEAKKFVIQAAGQEADKKTIEKKIAKAYDGTIKTLEVYVKPEEGKAYYFINGKDDGSVDLF